MTKVVVEAHGYIFLLGVVTVQGMMTLLIMTAVGMNTLPEHVLLHCATMHFLILYWHCQQNLSYAN